MSDAFRDYTEFQGDRLRLPIKGKVYEVPEADIVTATMMLGIANGGPTPEELQAAGEFYRAVLGGAYDEMCADKVPAGAVQRAANAAMVDIVRGREAARLTWEADPEALAARVAASQSRQTVSSPAPEASETLTESPSSGTISPDADTTPSSPKPKPARRGRKSSSSGD